MEIVPKAWEDAHLTVASEGESPCANADACKGKTARTVHGHALNKTLRAFKLPSGREFNTCVLCIRAAVSARWYEVLYADECPVDPIHEWGVEADVPGGYDSALCIGPLTEHRYVGVVAPFMRYDETTLLVNASHTGFVQLCVDYQTIPRLLGPNERVGARPLGYHWMWRTTSALLYAGFVSYVPVNAKLPGLVSEVYCRCVPRSHYSHSKWELAMANLKNEWLDGVVRASALGIYPHCRVRYATVLDTDEAPWTAKHILHFVREHMAFLVERDSPELYAAVVRAYPGWPQFVAEVNATCDALRRSSDRTIGKRVHAVKRLDDPMMWTRFVRKHVTEPPRPSFVPQPLLEEMKKVYYAGDDAVSWMSSLTMSDASALYAAAGWDGWKDRFSTRKIVTEGNATPGPVWWYMCAKCGVFKSVTSKWGGCNDVCFDLDTMKVRCHKKRGVGRKPTLTHIAKTKCTRFTTKGCRGEIISRPFGTHLVNINFNAYVACVQCVEALVPYDHKRIVLGHRCDACLRVNVAPKCEVCSVPVPPGTFCVQAFDDAVGMRSVFFCRAHAKQKLRRHVEVWSLDLLLSQVYASKRMRV